MTIDTRNPLAKLSPRLMAIYLSLTLIAIHLILLLGGLFRQNAASQTAQQLQALQSNVQELNASEQAELEALQNSRAQWQEQVDELEAQLPDPSQPFPVYAQSQAIAQADIASLIIVERTGSGTVQTVAGSVTTETYRLSVETEADTCFRFMGQLEQAGGAGLALDEISVSPIEPDCSMTINSVARTAGN